jgi:hypothetical protein
MHFQCSQVRDVHDFKKRRTKFEHGLWICIGDVCVCDSHVVAAAALAKVA